MQLTDKTWTRTNEFSLYLITHLVECKTQSWHITMAIKLSVLWIHDANDKPTFTDNDPSR